jgi:predicted GH43/DUF377 family glycosyl hydrolase
MKKLWLVLILFSVVFFSCKEESTITSSGAQAKGGIAVSLDKNTTPSTVAQVKVTLTREGYSQITGVMDILTDTTAELTINEIAAGQWSLKVDAYNTQNTIVYSGETTVNISDGMISQVNLTLYSTGNGVGGIKINVTWVNTQLQTGQWVDSPNSPIMTGSLYFEPNGVTAPDILFDNGIYKMWYAGAGNSARFEIGYATSTDGINWQKNTSPVLSPSYYWDYRSIVSVRVIKVGDTYKMYYTARDDNYITRIGLATSSDGINWVKRSQPVLVATQNLETSVTVSSVLVINDKYYLYYTTGYAPNGNTSIRLATSYDGINFTKEPNPVIAPTLSWEGACIHGPLVLFKDGKFIMYYLTYDTSKKIGYAESNDGINWTKSNTPVSDAITAHSTWCTGGINQLEYVKINNEDRLYYTGGIEYPAAYYKIGYLRKI